MAELVREIMVDATPETIWPFLVDPSKHLEWMGTVAEIEPDPAARTGARGRPAPVVGQYLEVIPMEKVAFTFGWEQPGNPITPGSTTVEISLHPEGTKTRVRLVHSGLPDAAAAEDHGKGWQDYLERLAVERDGRHERPGCRSGESAYQPSQVEDAVEQVGGDLQVVDRVMPRKAGRDSATSSTSASGRSSPRSTAASTKRRMCSRFCPITDRLNSSARSGWRIRSIANVVSSFALSPRR